MVPNSEGGYVWPVDDWVRLDRFLVLGSEGGSYYASEQKLTKENAEAVIRCIHSNGRSVVRRVVEISQEGRAPKNDPALFVLALCAGLGDADTRRLAFTELPKVARIGTHLFTFLNYVQAFRGWGRGLRSGIVNWYNSKDADRLAYQMVKYRQRAGWTHRDVLRKAHPIPASPAHSSLYAWVTEKEVVGDLPEIVQGYVLAQDATTPELWTELIQEYNLPREALPTEALKSPEVWEALLHAGNGMPMTAMVRNLANMTRLGVLAPMGDGTDYVLDVLGDAERIQKARIHPLSVLMALVTYASGGVGGDPYDRGFNRGPKTKHTWTPVTKIVDALDAAFYTSFGNVEPTNKRLLLGLDVSSSMDWSYISGTFLSAAQAAAAMALVTAAVEPNVEFVAFSHQLVPVSISPRSRLDDVIHQLGRISFGGTDCALPITTALDKRWKVDAFVTYTDSETWSGAGRVWNDFERVQYC
jgi:60 kDa SS-A/Ro ribonucleoprotein